MNSTSLTEFLEEAISNYEIHTILFSKFAYLPFFNNYPVMFLFFPTNFTHLNSLLNRQDLNAISVDLNNFASKIENLSRILLFNSDSKIVIITDSNIIEEILKYCWKLLLTNVSLIQERTSQVFTYKPYPIFEVFELKNGKIFPEKLRNFHGLRVSFATIYDPPRKFKYFHKNERHNGGYCWHILKNFAKKLNVTIYEKFDYDVLNRNAFQIINLKDNGSIEFAPVLTFKDYVNQSYFLEYFVSYQIVPVINTVDKLFYFLKPFKLSAWMSLISLFFFFTLILSSSTKILYSKWFLRENFSNSLKILIFQQTVPKSDIKPKLRLFFVPLLICGFLMVASYNSLLGSFLTKVISVKQINKFEDLKENKLKMMIVKKN